MAPGLALASLLLLRNDRANGEYDASFEAMVGRH
jgi:hypothetical protein